MAWDDTQESGSAITASEWNTMVTDIKKHWNITGMADLQTWNSSDWHNSSIIWDNAGQKWRPYKSGSGVGVSNLSDLTIDADKDWNSKTIYNAKSISANSLATNEYIRHIGSPTQYIQFQTDGSDWTTSIIASGEVSYLSLRGGETPEAKFTINSGVDAITMEEDLVGIVAGGGLGLSVGPGTVQIAGDSNDTDFITYDSEDNEVIHSDGETGFVGIGQVTPAYKLQVVGTVSAQAYSGSIARITNYISSQGGLYANFVSANNSNIAGSFNDDLYMTSANIIANYVNSTNAISKFAGSSSIQSKFLLSDSYNASGAFYPSSLGAGVSSQHKIVYDWFIESGEKLSIISGSLSDRINAIDSLTGATVSSNFFLIGSGNILWDWYSDSSSKISTDLSRIGESGQEYTSAYNWYTESSSKLSTISGSLSDRIDALDFIEGATISSNFFYIDSGNTLWSWYEESSNKISNFVASGDEYSRAYASAQVAHYDGVNGVFGSVSSQGPISGSWITPLYHTRPAAAESLAGQLIRTSGAAGEKTYIYMCVKNDADAYEWIQMGMST